MMNLKRILLFCIGLLAANKMMAQLPKVACGTLKRFDLPSKFVDTRHVDVWLPEDYSRSKKYVVLYMNDGQALFDSTTTWNKQEWGVDEALCKLNAGHQIKDCIVVGIWNNVLKRHPEYFPQKPFYSLRKTDQQKMLDIGKDKNAPLLGDGPLSDNYLRFLVTELKPFVDSSFSTLKDRQHTFIAGSSMGGLISMYAICEYPKVFGGAACLSTHWPGIFSVDNNPIPATFINYLSQYLPSPKKHKIYFDYGSLTLDAWYKTYQLQADSVLKKKGYTAQNWLTREFPGADHSENSWRKRLEIPLLFLLGK